MDQFTANPMDEVEDFKHFVLSELEQSRQTYAEIVLVLEQSQVELNKLTQRNASVSSNLQQMQDRLEERSKEEVIAAYTGALDAQQRLLVMRGQIEKFQSEKEHLQKNIQYLEMVQKKILGEDGGMLRGRNQAAAVVEMVIEAQEAERKHLSQKMHDGPVQALSNFIVQTDIASRYFDLDPTKAKTELDNLKASATATFKRVREFIFQLRPMMLDDLGLFPTVKRYVDSIRQQYDLNITFNTHGQEQRLESYLEVFLFRSIQELLDNSIQHNLDDPGKLNVNLQLQLVENIIHVTVEDNGKGFSSDVISNGSGLGLNLIRERVEMLGGQMEIDAADGQGARIAFQIPTVTG